ncbi:MAG: pilus assembly protein PilP [candidate division NC10 bacterium]|nr:pilus assembly protein PilP [candidate division NC10 bacterium]
MRRVGFGLLLLSLALGSCSSESPPAASPNPPRPPQQKVATVPAQPAAAPGAPPVNLGPATYAPKDRRDPFHPLVDPPREEKALDVGGYKLSGIVWQRQQYFALLETPDGLGHILKVNDRLGPNARVKEITKDAVLIEMKEEDVARKGQVRTIRLELQQQQKKEGQ